jgi:hypothetical protein
MGAQLIDQIVNGIIAGAFGTVSGYIGTSATTTVTIRASAYTPPGNNVQRSIKSSSANDTAAGTGARSVKITYFDASLNGPFTETITLNGTTAVNTVSTTMAFIEKMEVATVGSGGGNAGTLTLTTTTGGAGSTIGTVMAGDNRTFWTHHYVPVGKSCYVYIYRGSATVAAGAAFLNTLNPIDPLVAQQNPTGTMRHGTTTIAIDFAVPLVVAGPALIFINEKPDVTTASTAFGSFDFIEF